MTKNTYRDIYGDAPYFVELADGVFRIPAVYPCANCDDDTQFLDYSLDTYPVPTCSGECFQDVRERFEREDAEMLANGRDRRRQG